MIMITIGTVSGYYADLQIAYHIIHWLIKLKITKTYQRCINRMTVVHSLNPLETTLTELDISDILQ